PRGGDRQCSRAGRHAATVERDADKGLVKPQQVHKAGFIDHWRRQADVLIVLEPAHDIAARASDAVSNHERACERFGPGEFLQGECSGIDRRGSAVGIATTTRVAAKPHGAGTSLDHRAVYYWR